VVCSCIDRVKIVYGPVDLRLFQLHQTRIGMQAPNINSSVSALRFFFTVTLVDQQQQSRE